MAAPNEWTLRRGVPATARHRNVPALGVRNARHSGCAASSCATARSESAAPFTRVTRSGCPNQSTVTRFARTAASDAPYIFRSRGSKRTRPGSLRYAGAARGAHAGYAASSWSSRPGASSRRE